jgi:hypothetical protein
MKFRGIHCIVLLMLFIFGTKIRAQESEDVFPFHLKCNDMVNMEHECIYTEFLDRIESLLDEEFQLEMSQKNTFKLFLGMIFTKSGDILELKIESPSHTLNTKFRDYLTNLKPVAHENDTKPRPLDLEFVFVKASNQEWEIKSLKTLESEKYKREFRFSILPKHKDCSGNNIQLNNCINTIFWKHIVDHFKYPSKALKDNIQGTVHCKFYILPDGTLEVYDLRGPHQILIDEAERILKKMPKFKSGGSVMGIPFKFSYSIPITFKLEG